MLADQNRPGIQKNIYTTTTFYLSSKKKYQAQSQNDRNSLPGSSTKKKLKKNVTWKNDTLVGNSQKEQKNNPLI